MAGIIVIPTPHITHISSTNRPLGMQSFYTMSENYRISLVWVWSMSYHERFYYYLASGRFTVKHKFQEMLSFIKSTHTIVAYERQAKSAQHG
ncbi:hypothetical protein INT44_006265 [Umbelopsis vinacea]|uniref:Uncharacterized protein n=1 Tax=Umbelopsis vinacea TaxID=44442 RepID=A0A8H7PTW4_9FUNG|nr:hypothetical protein INT44_006265 [Umbelopsis vinacea]